MNLGVYVHGEVKRALEAGLLVKPDRCSKCQRLRKVVAHHDDYAKPEEIRWLCRSCHALWHHLNGPGLNRELMRSPKAVELNGVGSGRHRKIVRDARMDEMLSMRREGCTLEQIGQQFHITRERVRQIIGTQEYRSPDEKAYAVAVEVLAAWTNGDSKLDIQQRFGLSDHQMRILELPRRQKWYPHGHLRRYARGCRCDACRAGNARRKVLYHARLRAVGLCIWCRTPSATWRCKDCAARQAKGKVGAKEKGE
jgi:hypothetical protein